LRGDDTVVGLIVALRAAVAALPVASMERQRSLALGIQGVRRVLASRGISASELEALAEQGLRDVPDARAWADSYLANLRPGAAPLHPNATQAIAAIASAGIAEACIDDPDTLLIRTLEQAIADVEQYLTRLTAVPVREPVAVPA
jgi:hypothetical protein